MKKNKSKDINRSTLKDRNIHRVKSHSKNFTIVSNEVLCHSELSFKAKGLWAYLMSLPDSWEVSVKWIASRFPDGQWSVESSLNELKSKGYAQYFKPRNEKGKFLKGGWKIYEIQKKFPELGFPGVGNQAQVNTMENKYYPSPTPANNQSTTTFHDPLSVSACAEPQPQTSEDLPPIPKLGGNK